MRSALFSFAFILALSVPTAAVEYDPDNSGFRALDRELTEIETVERLARQRLIKAANIAKQRLIDCAQAQMKARLTGPEGMRETHILAESAVRECYPLPEGARESDIFNDRHFADAYSKTIDVKPDAYPATEAAEREWRKRHDLQSPRARTTTIQKPEQASYGLLIYSGLFWLCVIIAVFSGRQSADSAATDGKRIVDLGKHEWRKVRVEPVFDVRCDNVWRDTNA